MIISKCQLIILQHTMDNIRFSYQEKDQTFDALNLQKKEKTGIGKLLTKYERSKLQDEQEDTQIVKKKIVFHGNSLNYSQIYSDIRIARNDKLMPMKVEQGLSNDIYKKQSAELAVPRSDSQSNPSLVYVPKSLPRIVRNSRVNNNSGQPKWDKNTSLNEDAISNQEKHTFTRNKAFSISHYDIYKPKEELNRTMLKDVSKRQQNVELEQNKSIKNSSFVNSLHSYLQDAEVTNLQVKFQQAEKDLPQSRDSVFEASNNSKHYQKVKPEEKEQSLKQIQIQEIEVDSRLMNLNKKQTNKLARLQMLDRVKQKIKQSKPIEEVKEQRILKQTVNMKEVKAQQVEQKLMENEELKMAQSKIKISERNNYVERINESVTQSMKKDRNNQQFLMKSTVSEKQQNKDDDKKKINLKGHDSSSVQQKTQYMIENTPNKQKQRQPQIKIKQTTKQMSELQNLRQIQNRTFGVQDYMKVYQILKTIQVALKTAQIDAHVLIKQVKKYLQIVAGGSLDHVQGYDMPLHRLKIIKNALLYQRIALITICFAHASGKLKQSLKFLINLIIYATNNTLLILKILQSSDLTKQLNKNPILAKSDRLVLKRNYDSVRNNNDIILDSIFKISKYEEAFHQTFKDILKSIGKNSLQQTFYNVLEYFAFFLCVSDLHMTIPFLAVAPNPYLRETIDSRPTLAVDIVQIFCHGTRKSKSHVFRPHTEHFLNEMSQYYEIISFTCAYPNQIDKVIDILDPKRHIKHRLYRHHSLLRNNVLFKDTQRIGRDLSKLILLDSEINLVQGEVNNTIAIPNWRGNKNDTTLAELCPILAAISIKHLDCREATMKIHEQQMKNQSAGIKYLNFGINLQ